MEGRGRRSTHWSPGRERVGRESTGGGSGVGERPPYLAPYRYGISVLQTTTDAAVIVPRPTSKDIHATAGYSYALTATPGGCMYMILPEGFTGLL